MIACSSRAPGPRRANMPKRRHRPPPTDAAQGLAMQVNARSNITAHPHRKGVTVRNSNQFFHSSSNPSSLCRTDPAGVPLCTPRPSSNPETATVRLPPSHHPASVTPSLSSHSSPTLSLHPTPCVHSGRTDVSPLPRLPNASCKRSDMYILIPIPSSVRHRVYTGYLENAKQP